MVWLGIMKLWYFTSSLLIPIRERLNITLYQSGIILVLYIPRFSYLSLAFVQGRTRYLRLAGPKSRESGDEVESL